MTAQRLVHHELCFGCGRANLFGLLMEVEATAEHAVRARAFIKQDHQGAVAGQAHEGIVHAALSEAMAFACGPRARASAVQLELEAPVAVGVFLDVEAEVTEIQDGVCRATAIGWVEQQRVANGRGSYHLG